MPGPIEIEKLSKIKSTALLVSFNSHICLVSNTHISTLPWFNQYSYDQQKVVGSPTQYEDEDKS